MVLGATISYVLDPSKLAEMAEKERPTIILGVPRLYEKVYQAIHDKANKNFVTKILFATAFKAAKDNPKKSWQYQLADRLVFKKIKAAFGGSIRFFVSGSASLQPEIIKFFDLLGLPVLEGYGLTETSPLAVYNVLNRRKVGTIGMPPNNMEIKVVKGELWVKGPSVFKRYYKNPSKTKEAFPKPGWFNTGDLVEVGSDGYVRFLAREKEIIALSTGKKVSPTAVEERLELVPSVAQAFVFGDNRKHIGALIVPDKEKTKGLDASRVIEVLTKEIDETANKHLASYEQIKKLVVLKKEFSVKNGLLTPTLKLRRKEIEAEFTKEIESVYNN
jgi:long-chain acyl-CoA synthetase